MHCTSVQCSHNKIPYGGHCAFVTCPNYRRKCDVHLHYPPKKEDNMDKQALSASAQARMTQMLEEVLEPAMKAQAQRDPADFVYTAPEVWMQQVMNVGARIVNRAITIAHEEWEKAEVEKVDKSCLHRPYGDTTNCAVIDCPNYAGKYVRTIRHEAKSTREDIQRDNAVRWEPGYTNDVLGN